jgi:hypothetical protein
MGRETGSLQLLALNLLTGGKEANLVIRGDVVLNSGHFFTIYIQNAELYQNFCFFDSSISILYLKSSILVS